MQQQATGEIGRYDISFDSADGRSLIRGYLWFVYSNQIVEVSQEPRMNQ